MENYNRYYDQQSSQDYDQYNLWQNSRFHNGFHLQSQWGEDSAPSQELESSSDDEKSGGDEKKGEKRDAKNWRRTITRAELLEDPEPYCRMVFGENEELVDTQEEQGSVQNPQQPSSGYDWTTAHWKKGDVQLPEQSSSEVPESINTINNKPQLANKVAESSMPSVETEYYRSSTSYGTGSGSDNTRNNQINNVQKRIMKAVAQPIAISKATYMMERMGWKGGPLGARSDGIAEPIAPDATYITKKGFGSEDRVIPKREPKKRDPPPKKKAKMTKQETHAMKMESQELEKKLRADRFTTNCLIEILDFVSNDTEIEVSFDRKLTAIERKIIHNTVQFIMEGTQELDTIDFDNPCQVKLLERIDERNSYSLVTESEGERKKKQRQLSLFKEPMAHTYLVTPDDLLPEEDVNPANEIDTKTDTSEKKSDTNKIDTNTIAVDVTKTETKTSTCKSEENTNPFLKSIERNLQNDCKIENSTANKSKGSDSESKTTKTKENNANNKTNMDVVIVNERNDEVNEKNNTDITELLKGYFMEFLDEEIYTEFRFLGPFGEVERNKINVFFNNVFSCVYNGECSEGYAEILEKINVEEHCYFEVKEDCNGSIVIYKCKTEETNT